ncbi:MAG: translocation/assembly module TamB domain-containing protein [Bacteroidota bacterium]
MSLSPVQTKIAHYLTSEINKTYETNISISKVDLSVFGKVVLEKISILDHKEDTLFHVSNIRGNLDKLDLVGGKMKIDDLFLINPYLNITIYKEDSISNLDLFIRKFSKPDSLKTEKSFDFQSAGINIKDLTFFYQDYRSGNKQRFNLTKVDLAVDNIAINPGDVRFNVNEFSFVAKNGFILKKFKGNFIYSSTNLSVENLELHTPYSKVYSDLKINYPSIDHVIKKSPEVKLDFSIRNSTVGLKDINKFTKITDSYYKVKISMQAKGNIDRLKVSNLRLKTANNSEIIAKMDLYNILSKDKFDYIADIKKLSSEYGDLMSLLPKKLEKSVPPIVENLGYFDLTGKVNFKHNYLNTDLVFKTDIGMLKSNLEIKVKDSIENAGYKGNLQLEDFNLKELLDNEKLGMAAVDLDIDGKGFTLSTLNAYINGNVKRVDYNGYEYNNILIEGDISDKLFLGQLDVNDENVDLTFKGLVDAQSKIPRYKFNVFIDKVDLVKTNVFTRDSIGFLEGNVNIDIAGKTLDDITGSVELNNFVYQNENDLYYFDKFNVTSTKKGNHHKITIDSKDVISGEIDGVFYFDDIANVYKNAVGSIFRNYNPVEVRESQDMNFDISIKNKIVDIFYPEVRFESGTKITGSIDSETNHLKLKFDSPGIRIDKNKIDSITLWVDNKNTFFNTLLKIKKIDNKIYPIHDLNLALINKIDSVKVSANFSGGDSLSENYNLRFYETLDSNSNIVFGLLNSQINFMGNQWQLNPYNDKHNKLTYDLKAKSFDLDSVLVTNGIQELLVSGSKKGEDQIYHAHLENLELGKLIKKTSKLQAEGSINADITVGILGDVIKPVANLTIDSLSLNSKYMGDLTLGMHSDDNNGVYNTEASLIRNGLEALKAEGIVDLASKIPSLDVDVDLDKMKLIIVNVFAKKIFNNIEGYASGEVNISGPLKNPDLNGFLDLQRAGLGVNYTGVGYNIEGNQRVTVKDHEITIPPVTIRDSEKGTRGSLSGTIRNYNNYKRWDLDLEVKANNLLALNTTEDDNPLFYGEVYASGNIGIYGETTKLNFDVTARTEKGTLFSIPLQDSRTLGESSIVNFVPPPKEYSEEELFEMEEEYIKEYEQDFFKGMNLTFKLEVTPEAQVEIVLDEQVGDVMKGRGNGVFKLDIDTKGDFSINGTYIISEGEYLFTMQNLINKKFIVNPGGTIAWNGDPLDAVIDIDAVYKTKTQVASYLDYNQEGSYNKLLVELILELSGPLMKPDISFDIKMPDAEASLQSQLEMKLNESEEERGRQFIMLITLNSFASATTEVSFGGSVASSTAELVANQLSNIASGISDKFDVNVSYTTANATSDINSARDNTDELEVGLSSQLFDDRVTVNGNVGVPVGSSQSSIVGDVEILVNITKDGRYKGKMFTRQNVVTDLFQNEGYTQGIGISYQTNFDTFQELIQNLFKRKPKGEIEVIPEIKSSTDTTTVNFK